MKSDPGFPEMGSGTHGKLTVPSCGSAFESSEEEAWCHSGLITAWCLGAGQTTSKF